VIHLGLVMVVLLILDLYGVARRAIPPSVPYVVTIHMTILDLAVARSNFCDSARRLEPQNTGRPNTLKHDPVTHNPQSRF